MSKISKNKRKFRQLKADGIKSVKALIKMHIRKAMKSLHCGNVKSFDDNMAVAINLIERLVAGTYIKCSYS